MFFEIKFSMSQDKKLTLYIKQLIIHFIIILIKLLY